MSISALPPNPSLHSAHPSLSNQLPPQIPSPQPQLSAAVTRILTLSNFNASLKTRDLQAAFSTWENEKGGFKIKWIDDVTALVVFADANLAKRAYLSCILSPPPSLTYPATIRPYDGPDAQAIIHAVNARTHGHRGSFNAAAVNSGGMGKFGQQGNGSVNGSGNGFAAPQPQPFHVRSGSVGSGNAMNERPTTLATRMGGSIGGQGQVAGERQGHQRALSNSSASGNGAGSWGRHSIAGVLSSFGGSGSGAGANLPPLPSTSVNRLPTHLEGDTPLATPIKSNGGPGSNNYFSAGGAGSQRSSSAASNRSGNMDPHVDLSSPPIEIHGGNQFEGGLVRNISNPSPSLSNSAVAPAPTNGNSVRRVVPASLPQGGARVPRGSAAFGSQSGIFAGMGVGNTAAPAAAGLHARRESTDAGSAEKALDEVKKALSGLSTR